MQLHHILEKPARNCRVLSFAELKDRQGRTPKKKQAAGHIMALTLDITESMRAINIHTYEIGNTWWWLAW
jgi:hypothetical protein